MLPILFLVTTFFNQKYASIKVMNTITFLFINFYWSIIKTSINLMPSLPSLQTIHK